MLTNKAISKLIGDLSSHDETRRRNAALELADADERALYPLILALDDPNSGVQDAAMRSVISIGGEVAAYMVIPLLRGDALQRNTAIIILQSLGRVSVPLLYHLLKDKDDDVRKFALDMMGEIREDVIPERLIPCIEDPNANVRAAAAKTLGALQFTDAVPELAAALGSDEEWVIFSILETLGMLRAEESVPAIAKLLKSESVATRYAAIETLGVIGSDAAIEPLMEGVHRAQDGDERGALVRSLVQIGLRPEMKELAPTLSSMVHEGGWDDKLIAIRGLVALGDCSATVAIIDAAGALDPSMPEDEERLSAALDALRTLGCADEVLSAFEDQRIKFKGRTIAAELLGDIGSREAVPALIAHMRADKRDVRRACAGAMAKLADEESAGALVEFIHDADGHVRKSVIGTLGSVRYKPAYDALLKIATSPKEYIDVLEESVKAICLIDPDAVRLAVPAFSPLLREMCGRYSDDLATLLALSDDREPGVRTAAIAGLGKLSDAAATERLERALAEPEAGIRRAAVMALGASERSSDKINAMLADPDIWVRAYAVKAIGDKLDPSTIGTLAVMIADPEAVVALAAVEALSRMGGEDAMRALSEQSASAEGQVLEAIERALEFA